MAIARRVSFAARGGILALVSASRSYAAGPQPAWVAWSASPLPLDGRALDPLERAALEVCGLGEQGLGDTARALLAVKLRGAPLPELDAIESAQRAAGEPHPWPRAWAASAHTLDRETLLPRLVAWLAAGPAAHSRRCGVASGAASDGTRTLVVVAIDAYADLMPLPTRVAIPDSGSPSRPASCRARRAGVSSSSARGARREILPDHLRRPERSRASFPANGPGETTVQVVADLPDGPRPVLEAASSSTSSPARASSRELPGRRGAFLNRRHPPRVDGHRRVAAGRSPFARDPALDAVRPRSRRPDGEHSNLAHDAGDGGPSIAFAAAVST